MVHVLPLEAYDRMIGLELSEISAGDGIIKAPCGDQRAGRSPVGRWKQGLKRSVATDARGVPLGLVAAGATATIRPCSDRLSMQPWTRSGHCRTR